MLLSRTIYVLRKFAAIPSIHFSAILSTHYQVFNRDLQLNLIALFQLSLKSLVALFFSIPRWKGQK